MDLYLYLHSTQCLDVYPDNTPWSFKVQFNGPLILNGLWTIALTEFHTLDNIRQFPLDVYCNWFDSSFVGSNQLPIVRRLFDTHNVLVQPYYRRITLQQMNNITIDIKAINGKPASFLQRCELNLFHHLTECHCLLLCK